MRLGDYLRSTASVLGRQRFRTFLTLLGIVIGSSTIVFLAGVLRSANEAIIEMAQVVADANVVSVHRDLAATGDSARAARELSTRDIDALAHSPLLGGLRASGEASRVAAGSRNGRLKQLMLVGGTPDSQRLYNLTLAAGRFIRDDDRQRRARVCVVGQEVWQKLAAGASLDDELLLQIDGVSWRVVGVLAHKPTIVDNPGALMVWDRKVLVPLESFDVYFGRNHAIDRLFLHLPAGARGGGRIALTERLVGELLRRLHLGVTNFAFADKDGFVHQEQLIAGIIRMLMIFTGVLSLFAGGLNISNIMMIAVGERTREIGLRRALGATTRSIQLQFLGESALLAIVGGIVGISGAIAAIELCGVVMARMFPSWTVYIEGWSIALGLLLATLTGVVFGVMPARRAARLDPVEALRAT